MAGTAIFVCCTAEGSIVAADGREQHGKQIISDSAQKIFKISGSGKALGYAVAGTLKVYHPNALNSPLFEFSKAVSTAAVELDRQCSLRFAAYVKRLAARVNDALHDLKKGGIVDRYVDEDGEGTIAKVFIAGFYDRMPVRALIRFFHRNQILAENPETHAQRFNPTVYAYLGSTPIWELLRNFDPRLSLYHCSAFQKLVAEDDLSLTEAKQAGESFIRACSDPIAPSIDPECASIGGHLHLATVTEASGFQWGIPPRQ